MATVLHETLTPQVAAHRNGELLQQHIATLIQHPDRRAAVPEDVTIEFLPEEDPALAGYNLSLAHRLARAGNAVYLIYVALDGSFADPIPLTI